MEIRTLEIDMRDSDWISIPKSSLYSIKAQTLIWRLVDRLKQENRTRRLNRLFAEKHPLSKRASDFYSKEKREQEKVLKAMGEFILDTRLE